ncbi:hypothetical protein [Streptomyces azureus]|nr:hypothetical protein [Streptomyces azureus]
MSWVANVMISAGDADRANVEALSAWLATRLRTAGSRTPSASAT